MFKNKILNKIFEIYTLIYEIILVVSSIIGLELLANKIGITSRFIQYLIGILAFSSYLGIKLRDIQETEKKIKEKYGIEDKEVL